MHSGLNITYPAYKTFDELNCDYTKREVCLRIWAEYQWQFKPVLLSMKIYLKVLAFIIHMKLCLCKPHCFQFAVKHEGNSALHMITRPTVLLCTCDETTNTCFCFYIIFIWSV